MGWQECTASTIVERGNRPAKVIVAYQYSPPGVIHNPSPSIPLSTTDSGL